MGKAIDTRSATAPVVMLLVGAITFFFPGMWVIGVPLLLIGGILLAVRLVAAAGVFLFKD